jgi:hypothetical protein
LSTNAEPATVESEAELRGDAEQRAWNFAPDLRAHAPVAPLHTSRAPVLVEMMRRQAAAGSAIGRAA